MDFSCKFKPQNKYFLLFASAILLLYLIFTPLIDRQPGNTIPSRNIHLNNAAGTMPLKQSKVSVITTDVTENLMLTDMAINHLIIRTAQESRHMVNLFYYALALLLSGYGILVHSTRCIRRNTSQRTRVLSVFLGGHAPPVFNS